MVARTGLFTAPLAGSPPVGSSPLDGRRALGALFGVGGMCLVGGGISLSATTMQATVGQSVWRLPDVSDAAASFISPSDATVLTPATGPATGGRIDSIDIKQDNPENGDTDSRIQVVLTPGVASGTPTPAAVPAGYWRYAHISVPAGASNAAACTVSLTNATLLGPPWILAATLAALTTVTGVTGQHATVSADPTATNNGDYIWTGSTWALDGCFAMAAGVVSVSATGTTSVSFPAGRFTQPPIVTTDVLEAANVAFTYMNNLTTTSGFQLRIFNTNGTQIAGTAHWIAVQMTPGSAPG